VKFSRPVIGGILGGDAAQLLGGVLENVAWCLVGWSLLCVVHADSRRLRPCPLGVMVVCLSVAAFALVWVQRVAFRLHTHVLSVSLSVSLGFDELAPLSWRSLGREISQWWWCHPCCRGLLGGPLPTDPSMNRARGRVNLAPTGTLLQLCGGNGVDFHQLMIHPVHPIGGGWW
jgi:hypothetical protein